MVDHPLEGVFGPAADVLSIGDGDGHGLGGEDEWRLTFEDTQRLGGADGGVCPTVVGLPLVMWGQDLVGVVVEKVASLCLDESGPHPAGDFVYDVGSFDQVRVLAVRAFARKTSGLVVAECCEGLGVGGEGWLPEAGYPFGEVMEVVVVVDKGCVHGV